MIRLALPSRMVEEGGPRISMPRDGNVWNRNRRRRGGSRGRLSAVWPTHPEAGHHILEPSGPHCYRGSGECWECLASGQGIARMASQSKYLTLRSVDAAGVVRISHNGNQAARWIQETAAHYAGLGLGNVVAFYAPGPWCWAAVSWLATGV